MLDLKFEYKFVPASQGDPDSINWIVTISKNNVSHDFEYYYRIGCLPKDVLEKLHKLGMSYSYRHSVDSLAFWNHLKEKGTTRLLPMSVARKLQDPDDFEVLDCIVASLDVINYSDFSDWCNAYGYCDDSISDKKIYDKCLEYALKFKQLHDIDDLMEFVQLKNNEELNEVSSS